jgi:hypothetical protein
LPEKLEEDRTHRFLKKGQRNYYLEGEIPLLETKGNQQLSRPLASIIILEATHKLIKGTPYTAGKYRIIKVFNDNKIHFNGFERT